MEEEKTYDPEDCRFIQQLSCQEYEAVARRGLKIVHVNHEAPIQSGQLFMITKHAPFDEMNLEPGQVFTGDYMICEAEHILQYKSVVVLQIIVREEGAFNAEISASQEKRFLKFKICPSKEFFNIKREIK